MTNLLSLPLLQRIKPCKNIRFLRLERVHIGDEISGAERRVERRERAAEGFRGGEESGGLGAEVCDLAVEVGELLGCACFGGILSSDVR
jgi:hypothetical protein